MYAVELDTVWKKFKKGDRIYALRDYIPALMGNILKTSHDNELQQEEFWALKNVSFKVKRGEVFGVIGPNGAGKSTLLHVLTGIIRPSLGDSKVRGRLSAIIEITAGFHPDFTGRENVYFNSAMLGMSRKDIDRKFDAIVDFSGVREFIDTPVKRYSSGMSARLGFAIAAHVDPDVLLVDEVLAVGDLAFQAKCTQKMKELVNRGVTVILVSHNLTLIDLFCQRVILLDKGELIKEGPPMQVIPFYEHLVNRRGEYALEEELKALELLAGDEHLPGKISKVTMYDQNKEIKETFTYDEPLSIQIDYEVSSTIRNPVFALEIIRTDGVVCCESNTRDQNVRIKQISGKGSISLGIQQTRLMPNIYYTKASIWDEHILKPYAIAKNGVLKIAPEKIDSVFDSVSYVPTKWKLN